MDSATTSTLSGPSTVIPYSVSMPRVRCMAGWRPRHAASSLAVSDNRADSFRPRSRDGSNGRNLDDVLGVVIEQHQPVFRDVGGREDVVLGVFEFQRTQQVRLAEAFIFFRIDAALDRH